MVDLARGRVAPVRPPCTPRRQPRAQSRNTPLSNGSRRRLDHELVRRGLVTNRQEAHEAVTAGRVLVGGAVADKAARLVAAGEAVLVQGPPRRFAGRGGEKLEGALDRFDVEVRGRRALDAGSSTGGFTDCLLQRGASSVIAVDVGHGQLDRRLREDPRVIALERTNIRAADDALSGRPGGPYLPVDVLTADLSFVSLVPLAPSLLALVAPGGDLVVLVKPQFEAGRQTMARTKGVVRDPGVWQRTVLDVVVALRSAGTGIMGVMTSPLTGAAGNIEFFVHAVAGARSSPGAASAQVSEAVAEAERRSSPD
jgi:23S rRNA (cytidine1920-2'-O)/16S rRNA (cytidine1409-2'-O)-methyltransferase